MIDEDSPCQYLCIDMDEDKIYSDWPVSWRPGFYCSDALSWQPIMLMGRSWGRNFDFDELLSAAKRLTCSRGSVTDTMRLRGKHDST